METDFLKIEENDLKITIDNGTNFKDFFIQDCLLIQIDKEGGTIELGGTKLSQTQSLLFAHFIAQLLK